MANLTDTTKIASRLEINPVTILRRARSGKFPAPVFSSANCTLWDADLVDAFIEAGQPRDVSTWMENRSRAATSA